MAPELFQKRAYDASVDVFAYGTLLWEIMHRETPFYGQEPNEIKDSVQKGQKLKIDKSNVPGWVQKIIEDARSVNPKERPSFE